MITGEMIVLDIVAEHPKTEAVFRQYDAVIGECLLCNHLFESIDQIAEQYNFDKEELLDKLNSTIG